MNACKSANVAIRVERLTKVVREGFWMKPLTVLEGLTLEVQRGEVFGLFGPNGAGKTTTLKILAGLISPTSGRAWVLDEEAGQLAMKARLGFLPEAPSVYGYYTAREALLFVGRLCGMTGRALRHRIDHLLDLVNLRDCGDRRLGTFSKGMLQRVGIAQVLLPDPEILLFDEPLSGLDLLGRRDVRDLILSLRSVGKTILLTSHLVQDAEILCDRVGLLVHGHLVACGGVSDLRRAAPPVPVELIADGLGPEGMQRLRQIVDRMVTQDDRTVMIVNTPAQVEAVLEVIRGGKATLLAMNPQQSALEALLRVKMGRGTPVSC